MQGHSALSAMASPYATTVWQVTLHVATAYKTIILEVCRALWVLQLITTVNIDGAINNFQRVCEPTLHPLNVLCLLHGSLNRCTP